MEVKTEKMVVFSEEEYYYKLDYMVHSSCQHLRKVFQDRWLSEMGQQWDGSQSQRSSLIFRINKNAQNKLKPYEIKALDSKSINDWDMTLLSLLILDIGRHYFNKTEHNAMCNLREIRNDLAHHSTKKIPRAEYDKYQQNFSNSLQILGMANSEIQKLIDRAGITSSQKAHEIMIDLFSRAKKHLNGKKKRFGAAETLYTTAIQTPSLLPTHLGMAYEKRAEFYLKFKVKQNCTSEEVVDHALLDATEALKLNDRSWNANLLLGKCYHLKTDYPKAILHLERSLGISPVQKEVEEELGACRYLAKFAFYDPDSAPLSTAVSKTSRRWKQGSNFSTKKDFTSLEKKFQQGFVGGRDFLLGQKYYHGLGGTEENFKEAVKHFTIAANLKHLGAMCRLAFCYRDGKGVKVNLKESFRLFKEVAGMDPKSPGVMTSTDCNFHVAEAQARVGRGYLEGYDGTIRNPAEAAIWFEKSMKNGCGDGAYSLGYLYYDGEGVTQDHTMAERCWQTALKLNCVNAYEGLVCLYTEHFEIEKARKMYETGRKMKNPLLLKYTEEEFEKTAVVGKNFWKDYEPRVLKFEKEHKMDVKGLSRLERIERMEGYSNAAWNPKYYQIWENVCSNNNDKCDGVENKNNLVEMFYDQNPEIEDLRDRAEKGSETAKRLLNTVEVGESLWRMLKETNDFTEKDKLQILDLLYNCLILECPLVKRQERKANDKLRSILDELRKRTCGTKGEEDMKVRLCYVERNLKEFSTSKDYSLDVEMLREGIHHYPDNVHYYKKLAKLLFQKSKFEEGIQIAEEGLKLFPRNPELLAFRAFHKMRQIEENEGSDGSQVTLDEKIKAFKDLLGAAPKEHYLVPLAYYAMSKLLVENHEKGATSVDDFEQAVSYYKQAQKAEKDVLICLQPHVGHIKAELEEKLKIWSESEKTSKELKSTGTEIGIAMEPTLKVLVFERKRYLNSCQRKDLIISHRQKQAERETPGEKEGDGEDGQHAPKLKQTPVRKLALVTPITIEEMKSALDRIFENRVIDLTIIEDPIFYQAFMQLVAEDETGKVIAVRICNNFWGDDKETRELFGVGCRIAVLNPFVRIDTKRNAVEEIRVYEKRCIIYLEKVEKMCRFCGEEDCSLYCSKCGREYCSRECQVEDFNRLKHKLICSIQK